MSRKTQRYSKEFIDRNLNPQKTKKAPQNGCFFNTPCAPYERKSDAFYGAEAGLPTGRAGPDA